MCHEILKNQNRLICPECEKELHPISGARCMKCGRPVDKEEEYCKECGKHHAKFTQGKSVFLYNEKWKHSIEKYKYYGYREYGDFYAKAMFAFAGDSIARWNPDVILPVPLHRKKQKIRGFNQSAYLAERISRFSGIPYEENTIYKRCMTKSQKKLNAQERRKNLKGAFGLLREVRGKSFLVIDDVYTTGSTIEAVTECLLEGGAEKVYFLTLCMGIQ